jgi:hypothetical protein
MKQQRSFISIRSDPFNMDELAVDDRFSEVLGEMDEKKQLAKACNFIAWLASERDEIGRDEFRNYMMVASCIVRPSDDLLQPETNKNAIRFARKELEGVF